MREDFAELEAAIALLITSGKEQTCVPLAEPIQTELDVGTAYAPFILIEEERVRRYGSAQERLKKMQASLNNVQNMVNQFEKVAVLRRNWLQVEVSDGKGRITGKMW